MTVNVIIILTILVTGLILWSPVVHRVKTWRAMMTPLASIIGSGFLVLGPILETAYGKYAPIVMVALCLGAYFYGAAIRYNINDIEFRDPGRFWLMEKLEIAASWSLGFAYIISVAYYLNLFGSFGVSLTAVNDAMHSKLLTSAVFIVILFVGWTRGFKTLEHLEYISVTTKLTIIAGLLIGLAIYFSDKVSQDGLIYNPPMQSGWSSIALAFGLIVTVQGFETSRYLSDAYDSQTRIRSMKFAQWVSSTIYIVYICLLAYVFERGTLKLTETAIIDIMGIVAPILPLLLVAAALAAQFSAAIADTSGCGGLLGELSRNRISARMSYCLLTGVGLALTWSVNIFEIINYASRAFAAYYFLQALIATLNAWRAGDRWRSCGFMMMAILGILIVIFGMPVEG